MKYVSIDTETTGTNPERNQVIEFGAVIENAAEFKPLENLPTFKRLIKHEEYVGQLVAINMNARVFQEIAAADGSTTICKPEELAEQFKTFLVNNSYEADEKGRVRIIAAGKNFAGFDLQFLNRLPNWRQHIRISHKVIDPGILFTDFVKDEGIPSLDECKQRAGIEGAVTHDALADALDIVKLIRHFLSFTLIK